MENPVDHSLDLGFVNYTAHPENNKYVVFRFADPKRATSFEEKLNEGQIWFEKSMEERRGREYALFGIHQTDFKRVQQINYQVEAKHKQFIIPNKFFRYALLIFSAVVMTLTIIGYIKSKNESPESIKARIESTNIK